MSPRDRRAALAVWVKTPGRTPAKTRLARAVGAPAAETFYRLAVDAVREAVEGACALAPGLVAPYWAVAEEDDAALAHWRGRGGFAAVAQGGGGLGERLSRVYDGLRARHAAVLFVGADAPQVAPARLADAARALVSGEDDFVLGPAEDGGFWLFGGRLEVPGTDWTAVEYSAPTTGRDLAARLAPRGRLREVERDFDVDTVDELARLRGALAARADLGAAGARLREWLAAEGSAW